MSLAYVLGLQFVPVNCTEQLEQFKLTKRVNVQVVCPRPSSSGSSSQVHLLLSRIVPSPPLWEGLCWPYQESNGLRD